LVNSLENGVRTLERIQVIREKRAQRMLGEARAIVIQRDAVRDVAKVALSAAVNEEELRSAKVKVRAKNGKITGHQLIANSCFVASARPAIVEAEKSLIAADQMLAVATEKEYDARLGYLYERTKIKKIDQLKQRARKKTAVETEIRSEDETDEFNVNQFRSKSIVAKS
jgi:hypothetical protein